MPCAEALFFGERWLYLAFNFTTSVTEQALAAASVDRTGHSKIHPIHETCAATACAALFALALKANDIDEIGHGRPFGAWLAALGTFE